MGPRSGWEAGRGPEQRTGLERAAGLSPGNLPGWGRLRVRDSFWMERRPGHQGGVRGRVSGTGEAVFAVECGDVASLAQDGVPGGKGRR